MYFFNHYTFNRCISLHAIDHGRYMYMYMYMGLTQNGKNKHVQSTHPKYNRMYVHVHVVTRENVVP